MRNNSTKLIKCNFCMQDATISNQFSGSLNICEGCFNKAIKTSCFKVVSPSGQIYQIYLVRKSFQITDSYENINSAGIDFLGQIDQLQQQQIKLIIDKWTHIGNSISNYKNINQDKINTIKSILQQSKKQIFNHQTSTAILLEKQFIIEKPIILEIDQSIGQRDGNQQIQENQQNFDNNTNQGSLNTLCIDHFRENDENSRSKSKRLLIKSRRSMQQKQNQKTLRNISQKTDPIYDISHIWSWNKGPQIFLGMRYPIKSQNCLQLQKSQFLSKLYAQKYKIYQYLQRQGRISPVLYKIFTDSICQAIYNTNIGNKCIQLVSYKLNNLDFLCYLEMLDWKDIQILKLVKVNLNDQYGKILIDFLQNKSIESLVLTNNKLTQQFCKTLANKNIQNLKNIYLGKNQIYQMKVRKQIKVLKQKYNIYL